MTIDHQTRHQLLNIISRVMLIAGIFLFNKTTAYSADSLSDVSISPAASEISVPTAKKNQKIIVKKQKKKKHLSKRKKMPHVNTAPGIEKIFENDRQESKCNRLNCASSFKIAKACLPDKHSHRQHTKCFRAFCAYGCNDMDYNKNPSLHEFCNKTCSSKKNHGMK